MKGSIIKRGKGTYQLRISLGHDETSGKRIYKHRTVHCTLKEAQRQLRDLVAQYEGGLIVVKEDRTSLNKLLEQWLALGKTGDVSDSTITTYRRIVRYYVGPGLGKTPIHRLTAADIREFFLELSRRGLSRSVIRLSTTVLRQALDMAVAEGRIAINPSAGVKKPTKKREAKTKVVRSLDKDQANIFVRRAEEERDGVLFKVALISGMRPGEYLGLTLPHIDWKSNEISVTQALTKDEAGKWVLGATKTRSGIRRIAMPPEAMQELRGYIDGPRRLLREFAGEAWQEHNLVFPNQSGGYRAKSSVRELFKSILRRSNLPPFRLYDLRHTMATLLLQADENVKVVSERMGHDGPVETLRTYAHVLPSMQVRAASKLGDMFYTREEE
jgi:integrase